MENEKFAEHPFYFDYGVINWMIKIVKQEQEKNYNTLRDYKRALCEESMEQLQWEDRRIDEVKTKILYWYQHQNSINHE